MKPIPSTAEILAFRMLERPVNKKWIDWAYEMLVTGFDTESLVILAGELEPYNQFEVKRLGDKVLAELGLTWDNSELVYKNYACYLIDQSINGKKDFAIVLDILNDIYLDREFEPPYEHFYSLYYAYEGLKYSENQYYLNGVTRENIHKVTMRYFAEWKERWCLEF